MNNISQKFIVEGGNTLKGAVKISGSKNAALPIIAAALLTNEVSIINNVPDIGDIHVFIKILESLNVECEYKKNRLRIDPSAISYKEIPVSYVNKLRASILLLAPLIVRNKEVQISYPGGCVLGKRSVESHLVAFKGLGVAFNRSNNKLCLKSRGLRGGEIVLPEPSVTATENLVIASVLAKGRTVIKLAAAEPHVQDLCLFLKKMGAKIKGIGTHFLEIDGVKKLRGVSYKVTSDYLEAGTLAIAAAITKGDVLIEDVGIDHLDSFWLKLNEIGVNMELYKDSVKILPPKKRGYTAIRKLETGVYPKFPTDLQAPLAVLLSQAKGVSRIFETLFEGRLGYLYELEKLGANIELLNPHQALVIGKTKLKANSITSCDIRAGAAMLLAALISKGVTEIADINYIDRGYEYIDKKLNSLGANIKRVN